MNREIKFRAWHPKLGKMINVYVLGQGKGAHGKYLPESKGWHGENEQATFSLDEVILEQFTGLLDKNGKEIYEGDILLNEYVGGGEAYVVDFTPRWFHHEIEYGLIDKGMGHAFAVIGNIHQNPELLKV